MKQDALTRACKLLQEYRYKEVLPELYKDLITRTDTFLVEANGILKTKRKRNVNATK